MYVVHKPFRVTVLYRFMCVTYKLTNEKLSAYDWSLVFTQMIYDSTFWIM